MLTNLERSRPIDRASLACRCFLEAHGGVRSGRLSFEGLTHSSVTNSHAEAGRLFSSGGHVWLVSGSNSEFWKMLTNLVAISDTFACHNRPLQGPQHRKFGVDLRLIGMGPRALADQRSVELIPKSCPRRRRGCAGVGGEEGRGGGAARGPRRGRGGEPRRRREGRGGDRRQAPASTPASTPAHDPHMGHTHTSTPHRLQIYSQDRRQQVASECGEAPWQVMAQDRERFGRNSRTPSSRGFS